MPIRGHLLTWTGLPIIAVTGTNGKTTVTRLLDQVLRAAGYRVGMCCTDGVSRDGVWLKSEDHAGPGGVRIAARKGGIDILVAETSRGGIIKMGFGFRTCSVAIVTNVSEDHLGLNGIDTVDQMAEVKARLVKRVGRGGVAVLNADDPRVAAMSEYTRGSVIYYSMRRLPPEFLRCYFVHNGSIWRREAGAETELISAGDVAIARGGLLPYNLANAMALLGALDGIRARMPVADEHVLDFLKTAGNSPAERPFSFHLLEYDGSHVLAINSKNPAGCAADMPSLLKLRSLLGYEVVIGIITHVGNRLPEFHHAISAMPSEVCDFMMPVPPKDADLRGVSKESLVSALAAGIPIEKRLAVVDGDCSQIISRLKPQFPDKTLYILMNSRHHRGIEKILRDGSEFAFDCANQSWLSEDVADTATDLKGALCY